MHTQCRLQKGDVETVSWIPSRYANEGKYIKLRRIVRNNAMDGNPEDANEYSGWDDGWLVIKRYATMESSYISKHSRDYRDLPSLYKMRKRK